MDDALKKAVAQQREARETTAAERNAFALAEVMEERRSGRDRRTGERLNFYIGEERRNWEFKHRGHGDRREKI